MNAKVFSPWLLGDTHNISSHNSSSNNKKKHFQLRQIEIDLEPESGREKGQVERRNDELFAGKN